MDVWRITVAALRRWYILLPLLALTGVAAVAVGEGVRPQYEVTGTAIITPPLVSSETPNPYGGTDDANTVVAIVLGSPESREQVAALDLDSNYQIAPQSRSSIWNFSVLSDSPERGLATGDAIMELAVQELSDRQGAAGIPSHAQFGLDVLQAPSVSAVVTEGKTRNTAIVGLLGASLSLLTAVLFDDLVGLVKRWRQRRRGGSGADRSPTPADEVADAGATERISAAEPSRRPPASGDDPAPPFDGNWTRHKSSAQSGHGPRDLARASRDG